jgi:large conductance mechanosensitive channel
VLQLESVFLRENFIARGNLIDLAFGVVVVVWLGTIFDSLIRDVIMPLLSLTTGMPDLSWVKPFGVRVGDFFDALFVFLFKIASIYFLVVFPLNRLVQRIVLAKIPLKPDSYWALAITTAGTFNSAPFDMGRRFDAQLLYSRDPS